MSVLLLLMLVQPMALGQTEADESVAAGREALDYWWPWNYPWYDSETDGVRRVELRRPWDWSWLRQWAAGVRDWTVGLMPDWLVDFGRWLRDCASAFWYWLTNLGWGSLFRWPRSPWGWVVRIVLLLLSVLVLYLLARTCRKWQGGPAGSKHRRRGTSEDAGDADRIEALPFPVEPGRLDLLGEARRLYQQGNYRRAIVYLFSFELVQLDRQQIIRLTKGKTNRQYVREVGRRGPLRRLLEHTMVVFEDVFFGDYPLDRARFESCWTRLEEFRSLIVQPVG